jgi:hypothetical protein
MTSIIKWMIAFVLAGLAWLVGNYTVEYFRPYRRE